MNDIFISYSRKDSNVVGEFVWRFEQEGFNVWIDKDGIYSGNEFADIIATAIEESTVVVFFSSEDSNSSKWTAGEIGIASMYDKHIIPIKLDHSPYNKKTIIHLVNLDYLDYTDPSRHPYLMEKLIVQLRVLCNRPDNEHTQTPNDVELYVQGNNERFGYVDNAGRTIIPFLYEEAERFYNGIARVCRDGRWGYVNKAGNEVVPLKYNYVELFSEDYAMVILQGRFGFVDRTGNEIIPLEYENADSFSEGLAVVEKDGLFGYINKNGEVVISFAYSDAESFSEGFAAVQINDKWGYINHSGHLIIPCIYDDAYKVRQGIANVSKDGEWGKIPVSTDGLV